MRSLPGYTTSSQELLRPCAEKSAKDFFVDWGDRDYADEALVCAELCRLAYGDETLVRDALTATERPGFVQWLGGKSGDLPSKLKHLGTEGFAAIDRQNRLFVVFRGTESNSPLDIITDARIKAETWHESKVHRGFLASFRTIREALASLVANHRGCQLVLTGHSLGAAIATLAAAEHSPGRPKLYTFGSPRVGDKTLVQRLNGVSHQRYVNCCDIVARVPPERLDAAHVEALAESFLGKHRGSRTLAQVVSGIARCLAGNPEYVHHGQLHYVTLNQGIVTAPDVSLVAGDQAAARDNYAHRAAGEPAPQSPGCSNALWPIARLRVFLRVAVARDEVAFRDLADHTPLNYVAALAGQRQMHP